MVVILLATCAICRRLALRNAILLVASLLFYAGFSVPFTLILVYVSLVNYIGGLLLSKQGMKRRKMIVGASAVLSLMPLFLFKYSIEWIRSMAMLLSIETDIQVEEGLLVPVGISFFTFQALSYTIDSYRGKIVDRPNFADFLLFVCFFPTILSGPIEKAHNLLPQILRMNLPKLRDIVQGCCIFIWGLFKKMVVADRLCQYVDWAYGDIDSMQGTTLALSAAFFSIQLYCDFSGYSDMALGVAKTLGFNITKNFRQPFFSKSIKDLWRRWHIALTSWFTQYVYFPMGGSRVRSSLRRNFNIMTIFVLSGLWHGVTLNFIVWGGLNGIFYLIENWFGLQRKDIHWRSFDKAVMCIVVFSLFSISFIFFRLEAFSDAFNVICRIVTEFHGWPQYELSTFGYFLSLLILAIFGCLELLVRYGKLNFDTEPTDRQLYANIYVCVPLMLMITLLGISSDMFLYLQF
ncbi:MAG: MBOAT family protein [Muribaculum sp.]|nr:MBOAT family protein [Muribaculum sp.]